FEQEGVAGLARQTQVGAHRCKQVGSEGVIDGYQVSLAGQPAERPIVRLGHGLLGASSAPNASRTARRLARSGARRPAQISHCAVPWATNISTPLIVSMPRRSASRSKRVFLGR